MFKLQHFFCVYIDIIVVVHVQILKFMLFKGKIMRKVKSVIENLLIVVLIFFLIIGIIGKVQLSAENPYPSFMGFRALTVLTGSMSPKLKAGDIVIIREVSKDSIKVGDVVTYNTDNLLITHRVNQIVNKDNNILFITKGDANNTVDTDAIRANQIMGKKIIRLPYAGYVSRFISRYFVLFLFFIILYIAIIIIKGLITEKKSTKTL